MTPKALEKLKTKWLHKKVLLQNTTHFTGMKGIITEIKLDASTMFGYKVEISLCAGEGQVTCAEKFEGIEIVND